MNLPWLKNAISVKYQVGLDVVPILLLANLCLGVYWNLSIWYKLTGQTKFGASITFIGAVITLLINFIGIPYFGFMACAWATFTAYSIMMVMSYQLGKKHYPINYNLRSMFVFTALALAALPATATTASSTSENTKPRASRAAPPITAMTFASGPDPRGAGPGSGLGLAIDAGEDTLRVEVVILLGACKLRRSALR